MARPIAALAYTDQDRKRARHALPINNSDARAFCGLDAGLYGWQNLGSLPGGHLPDYQSGYCRTCIEKARQMLVLRLVRERGGKAFFSEIRGLLGAMASERELDSVLKELVGHHLLWARIEPGTYPNRVQYELSDEGAKVEAEGQPL